MSTATDIYLRQLPLPGPQIPVFPAHRLAAGYAGPVTRYSDDTWPLAAMNENPSASASTISWKGCPDTFREELRLAAWTLINGEMPASFLRGRAATLRSRLSPQVVYQTVLEWMRLAAWLNLRGIGDLSGCDERALEEYGADLRDGGTGRATVLKALTALTRLWVFDGLSGRPAGVGQPPWVHEGFDDYLPPATSARGENDTDPLATETMGPLLVWAIRLVEDFAEDILAAWSERERLVDAAKSNVGTPASLAALDAYIGPLLATGQPMPTMPHKGGHVLRAQYVAATVGASLNQVHARARHAPWKEAVRRRPAPCPLRTPIAGSIGSVPWRKSIDFGEAVTLMRHLATAAFIVIAYLTGMRPGEVLGLRTGCCPDPEPDEDGRTERYLIYGHVYKTARDEEGNHLSGGLMREAPWVAIAPVVHAVRVLERIVPEGALLFDHLAHDFVLSRAGRGSLTLNAVRDRIEDFVVWVNDEATAHDRPHEAVPPDPHGAIGTERFRRTLAWHIARRPGGLVALAIQYGHLRTAVSAGYASRSRDGIHDLLDVETARATIDTVTDLHADLEDGIGISGPAARRAINASTTALQFLGTAITARTARKILGNTDLAVYDNPNTLLMCVYDRDRALCHRDKVKASPNLDHCVTSCANIARTDRHADQLHERASVLETRANHVPGPLSTRLRANADRLRKIANGHDRTRTTAHGATS